LRLSHSALVEAFLSADTQTVSEGAWSSLKGALPDDSEIQLVTSYEGDLDLLAPSDRFFYALKDVPGFKFRVEAIIFTFTNAELIGELTKKVEKIERTYSALKSSEKLKAVLEIVLACGNYLNGTSARGGAFGFSIDSLAKVVDMRGQDGKTTLLDYIITFCEKSKPELLGLVQDFSDIDFVSKFPLSQLAIDLNEVTAKVNLVKKAIDSQSVRAADKISEKLSKFYQEVSETVNQLKSRIQALDTKFLELCELYVINAKDLKPEEFTDKFNYFITSFETNKNKYFKAKEDQEKKARIEARRQAALQQKQENSSKAANSKALADEIKNKRQQKEENNGRRVSIRNTNQNSSVDKMMQDIEARRMSIMPKRN